MCLNNGIYCIKNKNIIIQFFSNYKHCDLCKKCIHKSHTHCIFCNRCIYKDKYKKHLIECFS